MMINGECQITENSGYSFIIIIYNYNSFRNVCKSWLEILESVQWKPSSYSLASKDEGRAMPGALIITTITIKPIINPLPTQHEIKKIKKNNNSTPP